MDNIDSTVKDNYTRVIKQLNILSHFYANLHGLDCRDTFCGHRLSFSYDIFNRKCQKRLMNGFIGNKQFY